MHVVVVVAGTALTVQVNGAPALSAVIPALPGAVLAGFSAGTGGLTNAGAAAKTISIQMFRSDIARFLGPHGVRSTIMYTTPNLGSKMEILATVG